MFTRLACVYRTITISVTIAPQRTKIHFEIIHYHIVFVGFHDSIDQLCINAEIEYDGAVRTTMNTKKLLHNYKFVQCLQ